MAEQDTPASQGTAAGPHSPLADPQESERIAHERKQLRRLQMMMNMTLQVIAQDGSLSVDEASQMIADSRAAALHMFPGKDLAYDLIWKPRFQRAMLERFRLQ